MANYLTNPLDGGFERIRRAKEHLADLEQQMRDTFVQLADSIEIEFDSTAPDGIRVHHPTQTFWPPRAGILIGETCYNLRAALDYLVFELAKLDSGAPQNGTQFPIVDAKVNFPNAQSRWLTGVNASHVAAIERLQPYNGRDWARQLREASNPDKHRHLVLTSGSYEAYARSEISHDLSRILGSEREVRHPIRGKLKVKVYMRGSVKFDDGTPIIETLETICGEVTDTLNGFKADF
jgi:hypothetical protein